LPLAVAGHVPALVHGVPKGTAATTSTGTVNALPTESATRTVSLPTVGPEVYSPEDDTVPPDAFATSDHE
jgi:hypothetical protein